MFLASEVAGGFYFKNILWLPTTHFLVIGRLWLLWLSAIPGMRELYIFLSDKKTRKMGQVCTPNGPPQASAPQGLLLRLALGRGGECLRDTRGPLTSAGSMSGRWRKGLEWDVSGPSVNIERAGVNPTYFLETPHFWKQFSAPNSWPIMWKHQTRNLVDPSCNSAATRF